MNEKETKEVAKWIANNQFRNLSEIEKEYLKRAIDGSATIGQVISVMMASELMNDSRNGVQSLEHKTDTKKN